jgi:4-hydroxy-tetrahydrodipicolinate synthase
MGVGGNDTMKMINFAKKCASFCHGFMVTVPSYNKPMQHGIFLHYKTFCDEPTLSRMPVMIYNIPSRTGINMNVSTIKQVCDTCPNVIAIKEASGSIEQMMSIRNIIPNLKVFSGDDSMLLDFMKNGGSGVVSVASNVIPHIICRVYKNCLTYSFVEDSFEFDIFELPTFIKALFCETNPIPVKYLLYYAGIFENYKMRLPMTPLSNHLHEQITTAFNNTIDSYIHRMKLLSINTCANYK